MSFHELVFWISAFVLFYTYLGYPLIMYLIFKTEWIRYFIRIPEDAGKVYLNPDLSGFKVFDQRYTQKEFYPFVSMIVAAYNEEDVIEKKIQNCLELNYPVDKIEFLFVTDGSTDRTPEIVKSYSDKFNFIKLFHQEERKGKLNAIKRVINETKGSIIVFSDANAMYNKDAIKYLVQPFQFEKVGCVAGEKRVVSKNNELIAEGLYWKYESFLKKLDSEIFSIVGAAGEIFAIRKYLYVSLPENTINEDLILTMNIASKGYRVIYEPKAYAFEYASKAIFDDFIRRLRISTGGLQSIFLLKNLFDIRKYKFLSFQFISHRILRWTLAPLSLITLFISNLLLYNNSINPFFKFCLYAQSFVYGSALIGLIAELLKTKIFYFNLIFSYILMNFASVTAIFAYPFNKKTNIWKKVEREN